MHADDPGDHWTAKRALAHGIGQTRGSRNSKVHAICDALERPHVLMITPGNVHDMRVAKQCIATMPPSAELVGDKGYCSNELWAWLAERGTQAVILNKRNRRVHHKFNPAIYKQRNVVERMFCRFKDCTVSQYALIATSKNFMATIAIAATVIW